MSSGSSAFKAAAVAAVLSLLVLPCFGRCPSLGPATPPAPAPVTPPPAPAPVPAPSPGPAPPVSCSDCRAPLIPACFSKCSGACNNYCNPPPGCDECRARANNCTACCKDGTCDCACKTNTDYDCHGGCYVSIRGCQICQSTSLNQCMGDCLSDCADTCAKE